MMDGYSMSGWAWLLMTLGMLGFWALVAVVAVALFRRPGGRDQQKQPGAAGLVADAGEEGQPWWRALPTARDPLLGAVDLRGPTTSAIPSRPGSRTPASRPGSSTR